MGTRKKKKKKAGAAPPPCEPEPEAEKAAPSTEQASPRRRVPPVDEKIGEPPDNLKRRSEWFRRRTGEKS